MRLQTEAVVALTLAALQITVAIRAVEAWVVLVL
jgi:hypothetical protein